MSRARRDSERQYENARRLAGMRECESHDVLYYCYWCGMHSAFARNMHTNNIWTHEHCAHTLRDARRVANTKQQINSMQVCDNDECALFATEIASDSSAHRASGVSGGSRCRSFIVWPGRNVGRVDSE